MVPCNTWQHVQWTLLAGVLIAGLLIAPSAVTAQQATITTDGPSTASPEETITVTVTLKNTKSSQENYIADVSLPEGWSVASHTDDGGTWNSGDVSWLWQNVPANSSVTPTLTVNVPAEASGTATIETTAKSKDGAEDTTTHTVELPSSRDDSAADDENDESDDSDNSDDDSAGGSNGDSNSGADSESSGSSDTTDAESTQGSQASEEPTTDEESQATTGTEARGVPSQTVHTIEDSNPEQPGTTVETSSSSAVDRVTFDADSVTGELNIEEYDENIPQEIGAEISADIARDLSSVEANESGGSSEEGQSEADSEPESSGTDTVQNDSQATAEVSVITVADISPPEAARNASASVTFTVNRSKLTTPEQAVITHKRDNKWHRLQTEIVSTTDESVTLEANTESFSLFAVVEEPTTNEETAQADADGSVSDTLPTFHLTGLLFALVAVVLLKRYRL